MATRPVSAQKSKIRSSAGSSRLAVLPAIFDDTNSLWIVNSPMPEKTPGNVSSTRLMWSAAYMSAGLNPMIIGSNRACSAGVSARYCIASHGVGERVVVERRVGLQVVGGRVVARVVLVPHLLQRQAEHRHAPDLVAHHLQDTLAASAPPGCSWSRAGASRAACRRHRWLRAAPPGGLRARPVRRPRRRPVPGRARLPTRLRYPRS